ncbi:MAG: hypothetical protein Q8L37_03845 [Candidatus Gottesmanbacteria bacterium]|nr:hypothetical protein [Candidatus Gottesmanbacteria bacterium]
MKNLSPDERKLLIIQGLDILAASLAGIFTTVFFFSHGDLKVTTLYNIAAFASMTFFYGSSGFLLRYFSSGTLMKISLLAFSLFYLLLFFLKDQSIAYVVPLGILSGFSGGIYWATYNLNQYILAHERRRVSYFGWAGAIFNLASAVGPGVGGLIIMFVGRTSLGLTNGYLALFLIVALINIITVFVIGKLPAHGSLDFSYRHIWEHRRSMRWKLILGQNAVLGLFDIALGTVTGVLFFVIVKNEADLGFVLTVASTIAIASNLYAIPLLTRYPSAFWIGVVGSALSIIVFALYQSPLGVWAYIIISGLTVPIFNNRISTVYFGTLDKEEGGWQQKYHLLLERDIVLGIFRTISFVGLFIFLQFGNEIQLAKSWLYLLPVLPLALALLLQKTIALATPKIKS